MKNVINLGIIGLGQRGSGLLKNIFIKSPDIKIVALCDAYEDRSKEYAKLVEKETGIKPLCATNYKEVLVLKDLDCIYDVTSWEDHIKIAVDAMKKGIAVAMEVGCAYSEEELWNLVNTYEETKTPFMIMENCCFDKYESMALKMVRDGVFGEILHMAGAYGHDLRKEISDGNIIRHYRLRNYINRNCENYPTHEIGPIAKILNINRGNKFKSLVSISSQSRGLEEYIKDNLDKYPDLKNTKFAQGDIVNTIITCENGETISIKLDTTLPRFYARDFTVRGTKGFYEANTNLVFIDKKSEDMWDTVEAYKKYINNGKEYEEKYLPDFWKNVTKEQLDAGHGGMDYFEFRYLIDCLKKGVNPLLDVYDAASWMVISILSEKSIKEKGAPQEFPDFTKGKWKTREAKDLF